MDTTFVGITIRDRMCVCQDRALLEEFLQSLSGDLKKQDVALLIVKHAGADGKPGSINSDVVGETTNFDPTTSGARFVACDTLRSHYHGEDTLENMGILTLTPRNFKEVAKHLVA